MSAKQKNDGLVKVRWHLFPPPMHFLNPAFLQGQVHVFCVWPVHLSLVPGEVSSLSFALRCIPGFSKALYKVELSRECGPGQGGEGQG